MTKKALILDLDNTIYPVSAIGDTLFRNLFLLIKESGAFSGSFEIIKKEIMRKPFQVVVKEFLFSEKLVSDAVFLLENLSYEKPITTFEDYEIIRSFSCKKFLVTTGFTKLQESKIKQSGIEEDFDHLFIIDPSLSVLSKKDIFQQILDKWDYRPDEILVVGDDPDSEIKAGNELGLETVLYDYQNQYTSSSPQPAIRNFKELSQYLV